jgi:hypothetical protein
MVLPFNIKNYKVEKGAPLLQNDDVIDIQALAGNQFHVKVTVRKPQGCSWEVDAPLKGNRIEITSLQACAGPFYFGLILDLDDPMNPTTLTGQIELSDHAPPVQQPQDVGTFTGTKG